MTYDETEHPCDWAEDAGMCAGVAFITAVAAAAGLYGQGIAALLSSLIFH